MLDRLNCSAHSGSSAEDPVDELGNDRGGVALGRDPHVSAVACAAYEGLGHAVVHLIGASGSAAQLNAMGYRGDVRIATERDITTVVPELVDGVFRA